jgi:hypothetical protein
MAKVKAKVKVKCQILTSSVICWQQRVRFGGEKF